jgi:hypothetical protein
LPAEKWFPSVWPPYSWQVVPYPSSPPEGNWPWWLYPKDQWPYQPVPWENKTFGSFSARRVTMWPENLVNYPPFGNIKVKTPTQPSPNALTPIRVHMPPPVWLDVSPHPSLWAKGKLEDALREMSRKRPIRLQTESGSITIKSMRHANWRNRLRQEREEIKRAQEEENLDMLAAEIARTKGAPQSTHGLF